MLHGRGIHLISIRIHMELNGSLEDIKHLEKVDMRKTNKCTKIIFVLFIFVFENWNVL